MQRVNILPKFDRTGNEIEYTIDEQAVPGYVKTVDGHNLLNFHESFDPPSARITVSGYKVWDHKTNPENKRPAAITVYIKSGDTVVWETQIDKTDNWSWSVELPKYAADGKTLMVYSVDEAPVNGYVKQVSGYVITNIYSGSPPTGDEQFVRWFTVMMVSAGLLMVTVSLKGIAQYRARAKS